MPGGDTLSSTDPWLLILTSADDDGPPCIDGHILPDTEPQEHGHGICQAHALLLSPLPPD